jgi:hypothetical protein
MADRFVASVIELNGGFQISFPSLELLDILLSLCPLVPKVLDQKILALRSYTRLAPTRASLDSGHKRPPKTASPS